MRIKERDAGVCQLCARNYPGTRRLAEYEELEVHHIVPIEEDITKAFDQDNLITLCRRHHEGVEGGLIASREELLKIAKNQADAARIPRRVKS